MHGLSQIHLSNRGVAFKVKMAEDNEVSELMHNKLIPTCMHAGYGVSRMKEYHAINRRLTPC